MIIQSDPDLELAIRNSTYYGMPPDEQEYSVKRLQTLCHSGTPATAKWARELLDMIDEHKKQVKALRPRDRVMLLCDFEDISGGSKGRIVGIHDVVAFTSLPFEVLFDGYSETISCPDFIFAPDPTYHCNRLRLNQLERQQLDKLFADFYDKAHNPLQTLRVSIEYGLVQNLLIHILQRNAPGTKQRLQWVLTDLRMENACDVTIAHAFVDASLYVATH